MADVDWQLRQCPIYVLQHAMCWSQNLPVFRVMAFITGKIMRGQFSQSFATQARVLFALLAALTLAAGCESGPKVRSNFDKTEDFTQFKTFGFMSPLGTDRSGYNSIVSQYLIAAMRRELEARGLTYAAQSPQLLINFNAKLSDKLRADTMPSAGYYGGGYYGYRGGYYGAWPMYNETVVTTYTEGTLNIDVVDAARKQMVWEGVAVGSVTEKAIQNLQPSIDRVVNKIMTQFPIAAPAAEKK